MPVFCVAALTGTDPDVPSVFIQTESGRAVTWSPGSDPDVVECIQGCFACHDVVYVSKTDHAFFQKHFSGVYFTELPSVQTDDVDVMQQAKTAHALASVALAGKQLKSTREKAVDRLRVVLCDATLKSYAERSALLGLAKYDFDTKRKALEAAQEYLDTLQASMHDFVRTVAARAVHASASSEDVMALLLDRRN